MRRPVLLGGREGLRTRSAALWLVWTWLPVLVCICVIGVESTDTFSSDRTNGPLRHLAEWLLGPISLEHWDTIHHYMRKTGHFIGYGMVGLSWLRAWLLTWRAPLRLRPDSIWRGYAVGMALCSTMLVASCDEVHQSYLASRTGLVSDVWLDTLGATVLIVLLTLFWLRQPTQPR